MNKEKLGPPAGTRSERKKGPDKQKVACYAPLDIARKVKRHCHFK
ncbi:hypothetical protein ACFL3T_04060 [Patescibacteria group bacterium]